MGRTSLINLIRESKTYTDEVRLKDGRLCELFSRDEAIKFAKKYSNIELHGFHLGDALGVALKH